MQHVALQLLAAVRQQAQTGPSAADTWMPMAFSVALIDASECANEQMPQMRQATVWTSMYDRPRSIASKNRGASGTCHSTLSHLPVDGFDVDVAMPLDSGHVMDIDVY